LDLIDIEFMLYSCLQSAYKIYNIRGESQDSLGDSVNHFVLNNLALKENQRYTVIHLIEYITTYL
jgi:hypothetical protein